MNPPASLDWHSKKKEGVAGVGSGFVGNRVSVTGGSRAMPHHDAGAERIGHLTRPLMLGRWP